MGQERRNSILAAAREVAAEQGLVAMSVRAVAARAGIGASTLRYYFPSQQDLYDAVAGESLDAQLDDLDIHDPALPPAERLTACLAQFLPPADDRIPDLQAWLALYGSAVEPGSQGADLLASLTRRTEQRVDAWLAVLEQEGVLRPGGRRRHAATALAMVDGLCLGLLTRSTAEDVGEARSLLATVVERAIVSA